MAWPCEDRGREEIKQHLQWPRLPRQFFLPKPSLQWLLTRGTTGASSLSHLLPASKLAELSPMGQ